MKLRIYYNNQCHQIILFNVLVHLGVQRISSSDCARYIDCSKIGYDPGGVRVGDHKEIKNTS